MKLLSTIATLLAGTCLLANCSEASHDTDGQQAATSPQAETPGNKTTDPEKLAKLGEHLALIAGCHDCHTPKKMTENGPEPDFSRALSGHPAQMPPPPIDQKEVEKKGLAVSQTLTAWVGPWGISYAANLTPHKTGIGEWTEENFFRAMREGRYKGLESGRMLLPPMPWPMYRHMTEEELKALFAYLKSIKPIDNVVPPPQPPVAAAGK
ncbi:c-type cytochrome [Botryobacter ruber]|uniref:c-type cytochrome n=1 Tax=Botryobacter ruber TaxID=2171629 RepID=UPI00196A504E|nr:diheme cytochrome c-553 [Botryobacter ruber]